MRILTILTLLSLPLVAHGKLEITGELKVKAHRLVRLEAKGQPADAILIWDVAPEEQCDVEEFGNKLIFSAPPGTYRVRLRSITLQGGKTQSESARVTVTIEGATPPAPPIPDTGKPDAIQATCRLRFGNSGCTATIIGPRRADGRWDVLAAAHCTGSVGSQGTITLKDGRTLRVRVTARNTRSDLVWMVTETAVDRLPFAHLSRTHPPIGTAIWHMGYGIDRPGNREDGTITGPTSADGQLAMRLSVSSGDSGSGIFRSDNHELIAVVCCTSGRTTYGGSSVAALALRPTK